MRKTKIICTLGPATDGPGVLRDMISAGMNVARFNFSHGTHPDHRMRLNALKQAREELDIPVAAMLDTKGPEIRLKNFQGGRVELREGTQFTLTTRAVEGTEEICSITYKELPQDVAPGAKIMLDDGLISLRVLSCTDTDIVCTVEDGGPIKDHKGVNVPGVHLNMPYLSAQDREDIAFGVAEGFDYIAASFCRSERDILDIRRMLEETASQIRIIAKIENQEGVDNLDGILAVADGVMVARGDLGVEVDFAEIPVIQKDIISRAIAAGKTVITATQMLDSMMTNPRPTRAEITDVANAVYDGTSAVMLSGETAAGKYPVEAVETMAAIARRTETDINYFGRMRKAAGEARLGISGATAHAACTTAVDTNASAIISVSKSGTTAKLISRYRPETPIIACVMSREVQRQLALAWGITPLLMPFASSTDEMVETSVSVACDAGLVENGEIVVVTAGVPVGVSGTTNMIKVHMVGSCLIAGIGIGQNNARGRLCVCRDVMDMQAKFHPGMVLVVPCTNNEMLPYIREAAAVISEEGGQSSHTAIVALSTGKPAIVGANNAMRVLRDGGYVSVDCLHGTVQNLEEGAL